MNLIDIAQLKSACVPSSVIDLRHGARATIRW